MRASLIAPDLTRLAKHLQQVGPETRKQLVRELRAAAQPAVAEVRAAVLRTPSKGKTGGGATARARSTVERGKAGTIESRRVRAQKKLSTGHFGLRRQIAAAVTVQVQPARGRVKIRVDRKRLGVSQRNLPALLEGEGRWRHPVYGNRDVWVQQQAHPYFYNTLRRHRRDFDRAAKRAMRSAARSVGFKL